MLEILQAVSAQLGHFIRDIGIGHFFRYNRIISIRIEYGDIRLA